MQYNVFFTLKLQYNVFFTFNLLSLIEINVILMMQVVTKHIKSGLLHFFLININKNAKSIYTEKMYYNSCFIQQINDKKDTDRSHAK